MAAISNLAHEVFTYAVFGLSLLSNFYLIFLINSSPYKQQIGSYRYLLIAFAVTDQFIATGHALLVPRVYGTHFGYIFYGQNFLTFREAWGTYGAIAFVVFFYLTFLILCFHYVYRALAAAGISVLSGNRKWMTLACITLVTSIYSIGWIGAVQIGFLPSEMKRTMYAPYLVSETSIDIAKSGFLAIVFRVPNEQGGLDWQWDAIASISLALFIFFVTAVVIGVCIVRIVRQLRSIDNIASDYTKALQRQLFVALIIQTVIPCLFSYLPLAVIFLFPLFGFPLGGLAGDLLIMATAIFPAVDPILIIAFVGRYRNQALATLERHLGMEGRFDEWKAGLRYPFAGILVGQA